MTTSFKYEQGSIWLANVIYANSSDAKIRPVVVIGNKKSVDNLTVLILPITSQAPRNNYDIIINEWRKAGLRKQSVVRTSKVRPILKRTLIKKIGTLPIETLRESSNQLIKAFFVEKNE